MKSYRITSTASQPMGVFQGRTPEEAVAAMNAEAGCCSAVSDWHVEEVSAAEAAILEADAHTNNVGLPTYSELVKTIRTYRNQYLGPDYTAADCVAWIKEDASALLARIRA